MFGIINDRGDRATRQRTVPWLIALFLLVVAALVFFLWNSLAGSPPPRYYVALGDSISSGEGLGSLEESYPSVLFNLLSDEGYVEGYVNLAVSGFTTSMLLDQLDNLDEQGLYYINNAKLITINIGGNNILQPFFGYLSDLEIVSGAGSVRSGAGDVLSGGWSLLDGIFSGTRGTPSDNIFRSAGGIVTGAGELLLGVGDIISGAAEIVYGTPRAFSTFRGSFSPELEEMLENGVLAFEEDFSDIIGWLSVNAPHATIMVNTVYNPIPEDILSMSLVISSVAGVLIDSVNFIIIDNSDALGYVVVDTSGLLSNQLGLAQFNLNPFRGELSLDIIHPNAEGHELIAQLQYDALNRHLQ